MATLRATVEISDGGLKVLRHCYRFLAQTWPHADRQDLPDRGFEEGLRASLISEGGSAGWVVSQEREMQLGQGIATASGVLHEIDIVVTQADSTSIMELKNRNNPTSKNEVIVLFAKILDYMALNPNLLKKEINPVFLANQLFDNSGLEACLGLGIHPVGPRLRPLPILIDNARRIDASIRRKEIDPTPAYHEAFEDFCAGLNRLSIALEESWFNSRFAYSSESVFLVKTSAANDIGECREMLLELNATCDQLLRDAK